MEQIAWSSGTWLNPPPVMRITDEGLSARAAPGTDFWRGTQYAVVRDSGHALLIDFDVAQVLDVTVRASLAGPFHQAGLIIRVDAQRWIKAGIEIFEDQLQVGAVATRELSDWSCFPVPSWKDRLVSVRASRSQDAVSIFARVELEPWRLIRLAPMPGRSLTTGGPYCASPEAVGPPVVFTAMRVGDADTDA